MMNSFLIVVFLLIYCNNIFAIAPPIILPTPQKCEVLTGKCSLSQIKNLKRFHDATISAEGYRLTVEKKVLTYGVRMTVVIYMRNRPLKC